MSQYKVKIKDLRQNCTQEASEYAESQAEANKKFLTFCRNAFGHNDFEIL